MSQWVNHLHTINHHRKLVNKYCHKCGIPWQGLTHDLSKYSWVEFHSGAKYFAGGKMSPHHNERLENGFSLAWIHHKAHNKHHGEYWTDFDEVEKKYVPVPMPRKYVAEMICDRISASKVYCGNEYMDSFPLEYFKRERPFVVMHQKTQEEVEFLLTYLKDHGENETFKYIRKTFLKGK